MVGNNSSINEPRLTVFWISSAFLFIAILVGTFFPTARTWGFHFISYLPTGTRWFLGGAAAIALAWPFIRGNISLKSSSTAPSTQVQDMLTDAMLALACGIVFLAFSAAAPVLGDGQLWINELQVNAGDLWSRRGPLTLGLYHLIYNAFSGGNPHFATTAFRIVPALVGAATIFAWLRLARTQKIHPLTALLFAFAWGGIVQFFGYAELYSVMIALVNVMLVLMLTSLQSGRLNWLVPLIALASPFFNLIALCFWPAVAAYLWMIFAKRTPARRTIILWLASLFSILTAIYFIMGWYRGTDILLPLWGKHEASHYSILSLRHGLDLLNGLILIAGPNIGLVLWRLSDRKKSSDFAASQNLILFLALFVPTIAWFVHNPELGMPRDWDIGATCLLAVPIVTIMIWKTMRERNLASLKFKAVFLAWLLVLIVPWISVQASESRSLRRFTDLLHLDPERSATGWDYLGAYYGRKGDLREVERCYREALKLDNNIRYHRSLAVCYASRREWDKAFEEAGIVRDSVYADSIVTPWESKQIDYRPFMEAAGHFMLSGDFDNAYQMYELASCLNPLSEVPNLAIAGMMVYAGQFDEAEKQFRTLFQRDSTLIPAANRFFYILINQQKHPVEGWLGLGMIAKLTGDLDTAERNVENSLRESGDSKLVRDYLEEIRNERRDELKGKRGGTNS